MATQDFIARNLASAFLCGAWSLEALVRRGEQACGGRPRWLRPLARRVLAAFAARPLPAELPALTAFLLNDRRFREVRTTPRQQEPLLARVYCVAPAMTPAAGATQ
jgi:hypothetical protein